MSCFVSSDWLWQFTIPPTSGMTQLNCCLHTSLLSSLLDYQFWVSFTSSYFAPAIGLWTDVNSVILASFESIASLYLLLNYYRISHISFFEIWHSKMAYLAWEVWFMYWENNNTHIQNYLSVIPIGKNLIDSLFYYG